MPDGFGILHKSVKFYIKVWIFVCHKQKKKEGKFFIGSLCFSFGIFIILQDIKDKFVLYDIDFFFCFYPVPFILFNSIQLCSHHKLNHKQLI